MRKILLFFTFCTFVVSTFGQVTKVTLIPEDAPATSALRLPNGTTSHTTVRGHYIIPASEITLPVGTIINGLGFVINEGTGTPASGNIRYYLENTNNTTNTKSQTWSTAIASMTAVYNGAYTLPTGSGTTDVNLQLPFVYTGGGLYVAYDYIGSVFAPIGNGAVYASNNDLGASLYMGNSSTTTPPANVTTATAFRPQTRFLHPNNVANDILVEKVSVDYESKSNLYGTSNTVNAKVKNASNVAKTNVEVSIEVTGANPYSQTLTLPNMAAGETFDLNFAGLMTANHGEQTIKVSVPDDEINSNNQKIVIQNITCNTIGYTGDAVPYDGIGFGTGAGIIAVKYKAPSIDVLVNSVKVFIHDAAANEGKPIRGVVLNSNGAILATTQPLTLTPSQLGRYVELTFDVPVPISALSDYYVGVSQSGSTGFFPVGTALPGVTPPNRYYSFGSSGGNGTNYTDLGHLMIGARMSTKTTVTASTTTAVCQGTDIVYTATGNFDTFEFMVNSVGMQTSASKTFTYAPQNNDVISVRGTLNGCATPDASASPAIVNPAPIATVTQSGYTLTADQSGATYQWVDCDNANAPIAGETNQSFTPSVNGKYAVIITGANGCSVTSTCYDISILGVNANSVQEFGVYPNPGNGMFTLQANEKNANASFHVYSASGQLLFVKNGIEKSTKIDLTKYPSGVYFVRVNGDASKTIKLIKQ